MKTLTAPLQVCLTALKNKHAFRNRVYCYLLLSLFTILSSFSSKAQCVAPSMSFHSPVLLSGVDNQIGSVYLFAEVIPGVDAHITITDLVGGAQLWNIDDSTGAGYYDAFQPYVVAPANSESYLEWAISFKVAGSYTDTSLECFAITGVDVDGNGLDLQEFIEAATPGSYALDPYTILGFSFDGVRSKAVSTVNNIPLIDTAHLEAMFQMNFQHISTLQYRNGAISTHGADMVRQTCIYFKSFFNNYTLLLPVKLISFSGRAAHESVVLNWSATTENDLSYYVVQKSTDGNTWKDNKKVLPGSQLINNYFSTDEAAGTSMVYYRLKQVQRDGRAVYSKTITVKPGTAIGNQVSVQTIVHQAVNIQLNSAVADRFTVEIYAMNGHRVQQVQVSTAAGTHALAVDMPSSSSAGLYILTVKDSHGVYVHQAKIIKD
jgi:hypothetical protein